MVYGIVSDLDDKTTLVVFRGKKIPEQNIAASYHLGELMHRLKTGDTVYTISIDRFESVSRLLVFGKFCMTNGISVHFIAQPYLDISSGKHWRDTVIWQMERARAFEMCCKGRLQQVFRMDNAQWNFVYQCIERMNLDVLAHTFNPDGILKRGN